jgi:hypothetical protein
MITHFIHNRKDPGPNLIIGYCRSTLVRNWDSTLRREVRKSWANQGVKFAGHHFLETVKEKLAKYESVGRFRVKWPTSHRGFFKLLKSVEVRAKATLYAYLKVHFLCTNSVLVCAQIVYYEIV